MLERLDARLLLVTRGSRGMALFEREGPVTFMPIHGSDEIADVTGAGDTVISTFTVALAAGAARGRGRVARQRGGRRRGHEARHRDGDAAASCWPRWRAMAPLLSVDEAGRLAAGWRAAGKRLVLANGCFDLLHVGPRPLPPAPPARSATRSWSGSTPTPRCDGSRARAGR